MTAPRTALPIRPLLATLAFAALVLVLAGIAIDALMDVGARRAAVDEAAATLAQLDARRARPGPPGPDGRPTGSPVLGGDTVTVAGAGLMQRVTSAVTEAGGHITSSQVALRDTPYGEGFIAVEAAFDIAPADLQKLLYDLESGLPFLFVGQLSARPLNARGDGGADGAPLRLHVTMTVYGQWRGAP